MVASAVAALAAYFGLPVDNVLGLVALFAGYPLAWLFSFLPTSWTTARHLFSVVTSTALFVFFFDWRGYLHLLSAALYTYYLTKWYGRERWASVLVMVLTMTQLSYNHLQHQILLFTDNPGTEHANFDHTAPFMVLVIRLTSFAWSVYDGTRDEKTLPPFLRSRRIPPSAFPSLGPFLGYAFFFGGFLAGPAVDYSAYDRFAKGTLLPPNVSSLRPTLKCLGEGLAFLVVFLLLGRYDYHAVLTPGFDSLWFGYKLIHFNIAGFNQRCKFYLLWKISEGVCVLCGVGYNGVDPKTGKHKWDRCTNVRPLGIELALSMRDLIENWNIVTQSWLRWNVYVRYTGDDTVRAATDGSVAKSREDTRGQANVLTFAVSAFWHGFYPGYYILFLSASFAVQVSKTVRRTLRPLLYPPSPYAHLLPLYNFATWLATVGFINYLASAFVLLEWGKSVDALARVGYIGHVALLGLWALVGPLGGGRWLKSVQKRLGVDSTANGKLSIAKGADAWTNGRDASTMQATRIAPPKTTTRSNTDDVNSETSDLRARRRPASPPAPSHALAFTNGVPVAASG
ncbi:MBOAT-domain-containing protein [Gonapodya prolifera JEL478]|uniref:MBOAT-domain-containing protein n=1 Tax=Gonapodya prolifera (strain JEL478) TaxID=1344416 RepID=A0A139ACC5_GONPJ|nr:MBOAT-domain-containing protein [Gonapodya prolifera JEL478]|eukprot:KXS14466.1 MBOAT-domain-containing protein [Gonapodya prolifera JEL478]